MGSCLRSGNCCTSFAVCLTNFDILRISEHINIDPIEFVQVVKAPVERERKEPAVLIDGEHVLIVLRWRKKFNCFFYDKGCGIYIFRPMLCRTYPFCLKSGLLSNLKSRACPSCWVPQGEEKAKYVDDLRKYESEVKFYSIMVGKWNKSGGGTLVDFLKFITSAIS